jgi:hypothetical protein
MRPLGRSLQLLGLVLLPLGMVLQLARAISVGSMLTVLVAGAAAFWLGRIVEGYAR